MIYKRNLLFFDRQTDSLWSQLLSEAVTGPLAGTRLAVLPVENTPWGAWKERHPDTKVLSFATGYPRNYDEDPYAEYLFDRSPALWVSVGGVIKIYPFSQLKKSRSPIVDEVGGRSLTIAFDRRTQTARVQDGDAVTSFVSYLADLKAFYPGAEIYHAHSR